MPHDSMGSPRDATKRNEKNLFDNRATRILHDRVKETYKEPMPMVLSSKRVTSFSISFSPVTVTHMSQLAGVYQDLL